MLARVDSRELVEWQAYYAISPFGERREDMRMARICMVMANAWRGKNSSPVSESDFMFNFDGQKEMTDEEMLAKLGIV